MESSKLEPPVWVDQPNLLADLASELAGCSLIAVDTESNGLHAYREQVCLIQFSTGKQDYLVDPLALDDLTSLGPVFANPNIEKVFHAAEYDLICLKRDFGFEFASIFDTMQAARILGRNGVGLGVMLKEVFDVDVDKRYQRADWAERPLSQAMRNYARFDTHYLIDLRDILRRSLQSGGLLELAEEDFRRGCAVQAGSHPENDGRQCWKVAGATHLTPVQAAVLRELCNYREDLACQANRPVFKIMGNKTLLDIALRCPATRDELSRIEGITPLVMRRQGEQILQVVQRGLHAKPLQRPSREYPDMEFVDRLERLRQWRKEAGKNLGVESDVILPRDLLEGIAQANPKTMDALKQLMDETPWRFDRFGRQILLAVNNGFTRI